MTKTVSLTLGLLLVGSNLQAQQAQSLKLPTTFFLGAGAADAVTTYRADKVGCRELNPLVAWADGHSELQGALAMGGYVGMAWAANKLPNKRVARILLWAGAGTAAVLAVKNEQARRQMLAYRRR
jgi:hypothetical protein